MRASLLKHISVDTEQLDCLEKYAHGQEVYIEGLYQAVVCRSIGRGRLWRYCWQWRRVSAHTHLGVSRHAVRGFTLWLRLQPMCVCQQRVSALHTQGAFA